MHINLILQQKWRALWLRKEASKIIVLVCCMLELRFELDIEQ